MNRALPTNETVRRELRGELDDAQASQRRPTIANVERRLGVAHATFYRNYPEQVEWFKDQYAQQRPTVQARRPHPKRGDDLVRLRRENADLRTQVRIYAEAIRQLTLNNSSLEHQIQSYTGVRSIEDRHRPNHP